MNKNAKTHTGFLFDEVRPFPGALILGTGEALTKGNIHEDIKLSAPGDGRAPTAVHCRAVRKTFGEGEAAVEVLRGVDFEAAQGKLTFLVGPSGCGSPSSSPS